MKKETLMQQKTQFLGEEKITRLLVKLSLPAIVGMLVQASYNIVDALFIGHGVGALGLAGTAVTFPLQLMILAAGTTGGVGAASVISRSLGAGDIEMADQTLGTLITTSLAFSFLATFLAWKFLDPILLLLGATPDIFPYARAYTGIILFGIPLQIFGVALNNVVRSEGNARVAMFSMLISALGNMALDPLFIFTLDMGIAGAAWATVISQGAVVVWLSLYFLTGKSSLRLQRGHLIPRLDILGEVLAIGSSEFARLSANSILVAVLVRSLGLYGNDLAVAAYGVVSRVASLSFMPIFGIGQGLQPILGYNYGARLYHRAHEVINRSIMLATVFSSVAFLLLTLFPGPIFSLFTPDPELQALGTRTMRFMNLGFFCLGFQIIGAAMFQALGKARPALFLSLSRQVLLFLPIVFVLPHFLGLMGVWLAFPVSDILATLLTLAFFTPQMRDLKNAEASRA